MIAFACAVTSDEDYERYAEPGIRRVAEPSSEILPLASAGSLARTYNLALDWASGLEDLEALVLLHQDAELVDGDFCASVRRGLSDPEVAIVGCAGAIGVRSIAWWEGSHKWGGFTHRYPESEFGGGQIDAMTWDRDRVPPYARTGEVESIDGFVMALSPWAIRELRFDESFGPIHGYDYDICLQAREAGRKVVVEDFRAIHHHGLELIREPEAWVSAHMRVAEKWDGRFPAADGIPGADWKHRARRAEAEADAARMRARQERYIKEAMVAEIDRDMKSLTQSTSWRLTAPARRLARRLKGRR